MSPRKLIYQVNRVSTKKGNGLRDVIHCHTLMDLILLQASTWQVDGSKQLFLKVTVCQLNKAIFFLESLVKY